MAEYYLVLTDGRRTCGRREATELAGLAEVQAEAIAFGHSVLKHRFLLGIEDISAWSVRVSNDLGRVLALLPLSRIKKMRSATEWHVEDHPIRPVAAVNAGYPAPRAGAWPARLYDRAC